MLEMIQTVSYYVRDVPNSEFLYYRWSKQWVLMLGMIQTVSSYEPEPPNRQNLRMLEYWKVTTHRAQWFYPREYKHSRVNVPLSPGKISPITLSYPGETMYTSWFTNMLPHIGKFLSYWSLAKRGQQQKKMSAAKEKLCAAVLYYKYPHNYSLCIYGCIMLYVLVLFSIQVSLLRIYAAILYYKYPSHAHCMATVCCKCSITFKYASIVRCDNGAL